VLIVVYPCGKQPDMWKVSFAWEMTANRPALLDGFWQDPGKDQPPLAGQRG